MIKGSLLCCVFSSYFMFCFCFPCWLNNFSSFVGSLKDKHRIPWATQYWNTHRPALTHEKHTHAQGSLANNTALSSFIRPMHRCRACSVLMKNNLSQSVVALRQPFFSKCHLQRGLLAHALLFWGNRARELLGATKWGSYYERHD